MMRVLAVLTVFVGTADAFQPFPAPIGFFTQGRQGLKVSSCTSRGRTEGPAIGGLQMLVGVPKQVLVTGAAGRTGFATFKVCMVMLGCVGEGAMSDCYVA